MSWAPVAAALMLAAGCAPAAGANDWLVVRRDDLVLGVEVTGTLAAVNTDRLGPPAIGEIWQFKIAHMAAEGQAVKQGEPVLAFDAAELQQKLSEKQNEGAAA